MSTSTISLSPRRFRLALERFQELHLQHDGRPLSSFRDTGTYSYRQESYKSAIPDRALRSLGPAGWPPALIGTGEILQRVIEAIELPGNNLLQWEARQGPKSRAHGSLIEARNDPERRKALESALFALYHEEETDQRVFEAIVQHGSGRYELLAYLFFIARPDRFLPLRTTTFDKALAALGLDLRTTRQCGWENYNAFCDAMRAVQRALIDEGIADATLLDAHSFCWILPRSSVAAVEPVPVPVPAPFVGQLRLPNLEGNFTLQGDAAIFDMQGEAQRRQASGRVAEAIAKESEQARLRAAGRADLADRVELVSHQPALGFDIQSVETDGSDRFIEVKNVTKGNRFFLSENQRRTSKRLKNYWYYLVNEESGGGPRIQYLSASELEQIHLRPTEYLVSFDS